MYNILIISHGNIADSYLNTAEMIMGKIENVKAVGIEPGEEISAYGDKVFNMAEEIYTEDGILILADLYGGTPCNISISRILNHFEKIYIIAGFNFLLLLEALNRRTDNLKDSIQNLINAGVNGITDVNAIVKNNKIKNEDE